MTNEHISNEDYLQEVWDSLEPAWDKSKFDMKQGYDSEYECDCITITSKDNEGVHAKIYVNDYEGRHPVGFDVVYRYPGDKGVGVMGSYEFQSTDMDGLGEEVFDYFDEIKQKADVASFESDLQAYADAVKADKYDKQLVVDDGWDFYNSVEYDEDIVRDDFKKKYVGKTYLLHITFNPSTKDVSDVKWDISAIESKKTEEAGSFKVGESGTNEGKNEVSNFSRDSLGVSFDGKFGNMRKGESWVVYPETLDKGYICIQGDTRFGYINVNKGFLVLSAPHSTPIYASLMVDINKGKAQRIPLEKEIVDQILNAVNDRTITDHSLDNVIRNADVTDDELKGEAKQTEAEGSLGELIDKVDNMFHYHNKNLNNYQYNTIDDLLEALKSKDTDKIKEAISNLDNLVHYRNKNLNNSQYYLLDALLEALQKKYMKSEESKKSEVYDRPVTLYATTRYDDAEEAQKFIDSIGGGEVKVSTERNGNTLYVSIEGDDDAIDTFLAVYKDNYDTLEKDCDADVMGWTDPVDLKYYTAQGRKELTGESHKKSESLTLKQKELKDMARYGQAEDITTISDAEAKELKKKGIETVGISRGVYGMNGALLRDNEGNKYVITARSSNLFYFV